MTDLTDLDIHPTRDGLGRCERINMVGPDGTVTFLGYRALRDVVVFDGYEVGDVDRYVGEWPPREAAGKWVGTGPDELTWVPNERAEGTP